MPLLLTLRTTHSIPLEVEQVRVDTAREQSVDEVRSTPVQYGNKQLTLGEFFDVAGSCADDDEIVWEGDCRQVKLIGSGMTDGRMTIRGNAGMHLGAEMSGGEIVCEGDAADWAGAEMSGGILRILGSAGHLVGAAYRGGQRGMTGGEILVDGDAGNEVGGAMRRGLIAIGGRCGDAPGFNMIAGSIFLFGETGIRPGAGMRRGTILLGAPEKAPMVLPTFKASSTFFPPFLQFYFQHLEAARFSVPQEFRGARYLRYRGDFLEGGRGEILIRQAG